MYKLYLVCAFVGGYIGFEIIFNFLNIFIIYRKEKDPQPLFGFHIDLSVCQSITTSPEYERRFTFIYVIYIYIYIYSRGTFKTTFYQL